MRARLRLFHRKIQETLGLLLTTLLVSCGHNSDLENTLDKANTYLLNHEYDEAQSELLRADALVNQSTPLTEKEYLERLKGLNYLELRIMDKAKASLQNALEYSKQLNDTSLIIQNSFNLGLCGHNINEAIGIYENVIELAEKSLPLLIPDALEKLSQCYIGNKDYEKAQLTLDKAYDLAINNHQDIQAIAFTQCELWMAEDSLETALSGFKSISPDSCSIIGKLRRSRHIYNILYELGDYKTALAYKDSVQLFADSIKHIDGTNRLQRVEDNYSRNVENERTRFRILLYSSLGTLTFLAIILFFVLKNLTLKRRQISLNNRISELNVKLSKLQSHEEEYDNTSIDSNDTDSLQLLIIEKFSLSLEIFRMQPQSELLKKLNLIRDFDSENKIEIKLVSSEIIGRFSDACSSLRQTFPSMTNDDCLLCSMSYCGCSKVVISAILGSTEEAVRRRKSRVKQKLSEALFSFFFK